MVGVGKDGVESMLLRCRTDALIVGRDDDPIRAARLRALGDTDDKRLAGDVHQRLARQPR